MQTRPILFSSLTAILRVGEIRSKQCETMSQLAGSSHARTTRRQRRFVSVLPAVPAHTVGLRVRTNKRELVCDIDSYTDAHNHIQMCPCSTQQTDNSAPTNTLPSSTHAQDSQTTHPKGEASPPRHHSCSISPQSPLFVLSP